MAGSTATFANEHPESNGVTDLIHGPAAERIVQLLRRYPYISGAEASEIVGFLRTGRYRDVRQLAADKSIHRQLDDFVRGRRRELNDMANPIIAIGLILLFLAGLWAVGQPLG
jgi:hypothetical protein